MKTRRLVVLALASLLGLPAAARADDAPDPWARLRFLLGEWSGVGEGSPGEGSGGSTFALELDGRIMVRHNRADYPASPGRAATSHRDLLIVHPAPDSTFRAIYFDNEGHVIEYRVSFTTDGGVIFDSEGSDKASRFRLTYVMKPDGRLEVGFETAPPGGSLKRYLTGTLRRVPAGGGK